MRQPRLPACSPPGCSPGTRTCATSPLTCCAPSCSSASGFSIWNGSWYGGHYLLTHSVLFPPLAALFGARLVAAAAVVWSAYLFDRLVCERWGERARPATLWYGAGAVTMLASGRLSFALGVALGLASLRALQKNWAWAASFAGLACALASPVAAVFLAGVLAAALLAERDRVRARALIVAGAALVPIVVAQPRVRRRGPRAVLVLGLDRAAALVRRRPLCDAGAEGRASPARGDRRLPDGRNCCVAGAERARRERHAPRRPLRRAGVAGRAAVAARSDHCTGRRARAGRKPVVAVHGGRARRCRAALATGPRSSSYYEPLARWLRANGGGHARIEVPFTQSHWETAYLAPEFGLARGWMRQVDRARNELFYEGQLTHRRYSAWLRRNSVAYVALPDAENDYSAKQEHALIASEPSYLRLRATLPHWRVYEVTRHEPDRQEPGAGAGAAAERRSSVVRACRDRARALRRARARDALLDDEPQETAASVRPGRWTLVRADRPGIVRVSIGFSLGRARQAAASDYRRC